jgi:hypothetical protein
MATFPIFTPPSPAPFFNLPNQPNYSGGIAAGIGGIGDSFRANRAEDFAAQKLADENAYRNAQIETEKRGQDITAAHYAATNAQGPKWSLNTFRGTKDGKPALFVNNDQGESKQLLLPDGSTPTATPIKIPMGLFDVLLDPITNQVITGPDGQPMKFPRNVAGVAAAKALGGAAGATQAALPAVDEAVAEFDRSVDAVLNDPDLNAQVGPIEGQFPESLEFLSDARKRVRGNARKVMNNSFSIAYEKLKGAGPISEGEGKAATAAIAQLDDFTVSDETYRQRLQEAKDRVHAIAESQRKKAALLPQVTEEPFNPDGASAAPAATAPAAPGGNDPLGIR